MTALAQELAGLRGEPVSVLLTSASASSLAPDAVAIRVAAPAETEAAAAAFLETWSPDIALFLDTPDHPALISALNRHGCPLFLAAARRGAFDGRRKPGTRLARLLDAFDACLAPSAADAQAPRGVMAVPDKLYITGPLSDTAIALTCDQSELDRFAAALAGRPTWLAARVTGDEVNAMEVAQRRTIRAAHRLLLVVMPRDTAQGPKIAQQFAQKGWRVAVQSKGEMPSDAAQVYIADAEETLGLWYRLAPITVIGGSFDPEADPTDPYDVAALGSAIVHGPHLGTSQRFARLQNTGATRAVASSDDLGTCLVELLSPEKTAKLAHAGWAVTSESAHVVEKLAEMIDTALDLRETA